MTRDPSVAARLAERDRGWAETKAAEEALKAHWQARDAVRVPGYYWVKDCGEWEVARWPGAEEFDPRWRLVDDWIKASSDLDAITEQRLNPPE